MKKWGTKSEIGGGIIFTTIVVDAIFDLNPYIQIAGAITGLLLILSSIYDSYKKKNSLNFSKWVTHYPDNSFYDN